MRRLVPLLALCVGLLVVGCELGGSGSVDRPRYFRFLHTTDSTTFVAGTSEEAVLADVERQLEKPFGERSKFIIGPIAPGNGGHNGDYPWHFEQGKWKLTEIATEVCDASPSYVSENVTYFVEEVGRYCPWNARVLEEVPEPEDGARPQ
ncbi:MAG: hypothetical protein ABEL97_04405 [Salinibacter sp.]